MGSVDLKVVVLGLYSCGKTSLIKRAISGKFTENEPNTVGAAFSAKTIAINAHQLVLGIWDTAGAERYQSMARIYYRDAGAAIVCYDLMRKESFEKSKHWISELEANEEGCQIYLVGCKYDLARNDAPEVDDGVVQAYAETVGAKTILTSAKEGTGVSELFTEIALDFLQRRGVVSNVGKGIGVIDLTRAKDYKIDNRQTDDEPVEGSRCCWGG